MVFDTIITNNGEGYSAETGKFTAPLPGTYIFLSTILSGYNTKVETALIINEKEVARMYSGAHDAHGSGSNAAIVNLRSGDNVWVRLLYQGGNHVHGYYSTFSGAILTELEQWGDANEKNTFVTEKKVMKSSWTLPRGDGVSGGGVDCKEMNMPTAFRGFFFCHLF